MPQKKLSSFEIDGEPEEDEYEVEDIVDFRFFKGQPKYLVKWKGFSEEDNTWEPEANMTNLPAFAEKMITMKQAFLAAKADKNITGTKRQKRSNSTSNSSTPSVASPSVDIQSYVPQNKRKANNSNASDSGIPIDISVAKRKISVDESASSTNKPAAINNVVKPPQPSCSNHKTAASTSFGSGVTNHINEEAVEVEDLLDYKPRFKKDYFLVRWKGDWEDSWEPRRNLLIVGDLMHKMNDLKMSYMRIYGPSEMEDEVFVTVQSIRISGTATLSAVVIEMTRDTESRSLLPLQEVRRRWPQQLLDFLLSRLRLRATSENGEESKHNVPQIVPLR